MVREDAFSKVRLSRPIQFPAFASGKYSNTEPASDERVNGKERLRLQLGSVNQQSFGARHVREGIADGAVLVQGGKFRMVPYLEESSRGKNAWEQRLYFCPQKGTLLHCGE